MSQSSDFTLASLLGQKLVSVEIKDKWVTFTFDSGDWIRVSAALSGGHAKIDTLPVELRHFLQESERRRRECFGLPPISRACLEA